MMVFTCTAQKEYEREHRIKKSQFPPIQVDLMFLDDRMKQPRFYKEVDSSLTTYTMKFKLDRLHYNLDFNKEGELQNAGFRVEEIDVPSDTFIKIKSHLESNFDKVKIRRMFQEYEVTSTNETDKILKEVFQNMLLPTNNYKLILVAKKDGKRREYEVLFDAEGNFTKIRQTLPANYDHVLY